MTHESACCCDEAANHQLPIAAAFWISWIVYMEGCSSLTQNLMQIYCFTHSGILNVTATRYTCSLNGIYHPHWLVQWSHLCSCMHIPVHSLWLPGYINVMQTIFVILTMARVFPDGLCVSVCVCTYICIYMHIYNVNQSTYILIYNQVYLSLSLYIYIYIYTHTHTHTRSVYLYRERERLREIDLHYEKES